MSAPVDFLHAMTQALAAMSLYTEGHPARGRAIDAAFRALDDLLTVEPKPVFTFLTGEVVWGRETLRELRGWDWSRRLADAGVQRIEIDMGVTADEFEQFLFELIGRLGGASLSSEARQMRQSRIRVGAVGVRSGEGGSEDAAPAGPPMDYALTAEADTLRWLHEEVLNTNRLPLTEAEMVVRSLTVAMHGEKQMLLPLLRMKHFDQYTTTHAMNVSVLTMALAEHVGLTSGDVRAFGVAGLLHDIGKVTIPLDVLTKPGRLDPAERALMNNHTVEGARIIIETEDQLDLAAVVAYEHHIMIDGGGYPSMMFRRDCHYASKVVHVCDVYDALRTKRPYRDAWPAAKVMAYITEKAGTEFDAALAHSFVRMMETWEERIAWLDEDGSSEAAA